MISKKRLLEEFITLADFDSESFYERDIAAYLFDKLQYLGLEVVMDNAGHLLMENRKAAGNIYGLLRGTGKGDPVLFSAHMDTVAPGKRKNVVVHSDGRISSDKTTVLGADDISGIVAILETLTVIKEKKLPHPDIEVVFFVAEEPYCRGSSLFDFSKIRSKMAYVLDLDGKVGRIANSAPTFLQFRAEIKGKSAHAGFQPEEGISAITVAALAISRMKLGRIDDSSTANIGTINGGTGKNIVPGYAVVEGEVRSMDDDKAIEMVSEITMKFEQAAKELGASVEVHVDEMLKSYYVREDSPVIKRYARALEELHYGYPTVVSTFGGSDNNTFHAHGIEGIVISNAMNQVHTVNEYFYMDELVKSTEIVLKLATMAAGGSR